MDSYDPRTSPRLCMPSCQPKTMSLWQMSHHLSANTRRKVQTLIYSGFIILRVGKEPLTEETVRSDIIFVEMTNNLLEHMYMFCNEILGPVMQNPDNQAGWSDLVTKDLMDRFNNFVAQNYVMIGLSKGRTLLPLPNKKIMNSDGSEKDKAHVFEGCIVTWTKQIKNVLKL